jgi:hypothetical protein
LFFYNGTKPAKAICKELLWNGYDDSLNGTCADMDCLTKQTQQIMEKKLCGK